MKVMKVSVSDDERERLENCAVEPIRIPGAIQPHGALLTVDLASFAVLQASANTIDVLGVAAAALTGTTLADLVGAGAVDQCRAVIEGRGLAANPVEVRINGKRFDAIVHEASKLGIVEFESASAGEHSAVTVHAAIHRLSGAGSVDEIYAHTAREISQLTEFDRVVIYKFHEDGHGEVVAEELADGMEPYLGLHFPASDIPAQARQLYLTKRSRVIVLGDQPPAGLVPEFNPLTDEPVDLGHAELRSVSPHHVEFMRNMGQATTFSLSLIYGDHLIGMITCSHRTPRRIPYVVRMGYEVLARQVSMQLGAVAEIERLKRLDTVRSVRTRIGLQVKSSSDIKAALLRGEFTLLDLIPADGATLHFHGTTMSLADAPSIVIDSVLLAELTGGHETIMVSESLSEDSPQLHALMPDVAGILVVPFGTDGDYLAWYRKETISTVNWLGDQTPTNRDSPRSPRTSFAQWSESVSGKSESWDELALLEAFELRHDLNAALLRVAESELARVALHDPLTGLPNRRLLSDHMKEALAEHGGTRPTALLFADLDSFKAINDAKGHGVGDAVIVAAAHRLQSVTRSGDTVARIGGDEFVVLCKNSGTQEADAAANRILEAFSTPLEVDGAQYQVGVSIGVALAEPGQVPDEILHAADVAMYRAKQSGRNRASH